MRRVLSVLLVLAAAAGSLTAATAADLQGKWVVDVDATWDHWKERPEMAQIPDEMRETVKNMAFQQMGRMSWEITPDTMVRHDGEEEERSPYTVVATEGEVLTIESEMADKDGKKEKRKGRVEVADGKLLISGFEEGEKEDAHGVLVLKRGEKPEAEQAEDAQVK